MKIRLKFCNFFTSYCGKWINLVLLTYIYFWIDSQWFDAIFDKFENMIPNLVNSNVERWFPRFQVVNFVHKLVLNFSQPFSVGDIAEIRQKNQISEAKIDIFEITFLSQRFQKTNHPIFWRFHEIFDAFVNVLSEEKWQKHVIVIATVPFVYEIRHSGFFWHFLTIFIQIVTRNNWEKVESLHFFPRTAEQDEFDGNLLARNLNLRILTMSVLVLQLSNWFARNSKLWLANIWSWTNKDKKY